MMRVTNSMIVKRSKTNINANRAQVDHTNNQMSTQKKITKPSDNPIIAIRSLRLRSTLSTVTQYYENNIPDTQSWMDVTETALKNMKDLITNAYEQVVYGATDSLNQENRKTILKELQALQEQVYSEGNSDYAGRTVFTGYKTNQTLTFLDSDEAKDAHYEITEHFSYKDIEKKKYYAGMFDDTSVDKLLDKDAGTGDYIPPEPFNEVELERIRLSYDKVTDKANALSISYLDANNEKVEMQLGIGNQSMTVNGAQFNVIPKGTGTPPSTSNSVAMTPPAGYVLDTNNPPTTTSVTTTDPTDNSTTTKTTYTFTMYESDAWVEDPLNPGTWGPKPGATPVTRSATLVEEADAAGNATGCYLAANVGDKSIVYKVSDTASLKKKQYEIGEDEIILDTESGELLFHDNIAQELDEQRASLTITYDKTGFDVGELKPENYFNCKKYVSDRKDPIQYDNYDENWEWNTQAIYYNIAGGQQMQINTEARDVFNSDIRRDMDDLIEVVQRAITANQSVNEIKAKIESGEYSDAEVEQMEKWLDAAEKQRDYLDQNMHDTYSNYITRFKGYLDTVNLEITDTGGRGERVALTENRMSVQQSTFKELKSTNEDMDLSDLVINYSAASVAYQSALQAAAKVGKMTLLDFI